MSAIDYVGFSRKNAAAQGMTILSGAVVFDNDTPADSFANQSIEPPNDCVMLFHDGSTVGAPKTPAGILYAFQFRIKVSNNNSSNDQTFVGIGSGATETIRISFEDSTNYVRLYVSTSLVGTSTIGVSNLTWERITVERRGSAYKVFLNGDLSNPIIDIVAVGTPAVPDRWQVGIATSRADLVTDLIFIELDDGVTPDAVADIISASVAPITLDGAGNYTTWEDGAGGTGLFSAIDEAPPVDSDFIEADAIDERSTFSNSGVSAPQVLDVKLYARVTRSDAAAGAQFEFTARHSATDVDYGIKSAPGDGHVIQTLGEDKPSGGVWGAASNLLATEFGGVSRT